MAVSIGLSGRFSRVFAMCSSDRSLVPSCDDAMSAYADGDDRRFAEVHAELLPMLRAFLLRRVTNKSLVDDLVQETLLRVVRSRTSFRRGALLRPWALTIARRVFLDEMRRDAVARSVSVSESQREAVMELAPSPAPNPLERMAANELWACVQDAMQKMTPIVRESFEYVRLHGYSMERAASEIGTTQGAVKLRAHRAYTGVRRNLQQHGLA